jgi:hypothetical protein
VSDDFDAKLAEGDEERDVPRAAVIASSDEWLVAPSTMRR